MNRARRIAFVDYELENFHANTYLQILRKELKNRGFIVSGCTAIKENTGRAWAKKNNVTYYACPRDLDRNADCYAILAPSNPETHMELCCRVFPFHKTTYVDKTFAPDEATARKIFALADRYRVSVQTSSALRYTNVQAHVAQVGRKNVRHMVAWGSGSSFGEYAIHPIELVISCMGAEAKDLMCRNDGSLSQIIVNFSRSRTAVINVYAGNDVPFAASVTTAKETKIMTVDDGHLFVDAAAGILDFLKAGKPRVARAESLMIMRMIDAAKSKAALRKFVKL